MVVSNRVESLTYFIEEVCSVERVHDLIQMFMGHLETLHYIFLNAANLNKLQSASWLSLFNSSRCSRRCSQCHDRHTREAITKRAQFFVVWAKVMSPLAYAMCLRREAFRVVAYTTPGHEPHLVDNEPIQFTIPVRIHQEPEEDWGTEPLRSD